MPERAADHNRADRPRASTTRWVAGLLLVPSVPLLLLSVAALGLFYVAPQRFGELLARLPGDQYLRSALAFAPAALLAFVILAVLYALERPEPEAEAGTLPAGGEPAAAEPAGAATPTAAIEFTRPAAPALPHPAATWKQAAQASAPTVLPKPSKGAAPAVAARPRPAFRISTLLVLLATPAFLLSAVAALLAFIAPDRFWDVLSPLPGQRYLRLAVPLAPVALFGILVVAGLSAARSFGWPAEPPSRLTRAAPRLPTVISLVVAVLLWLGSSAGLVLFQLRPGLLYRLVERVSTETLLRVQLAFAPIVLFAVVLLAGLSLIGGRPGQRSNVQAARSLAAVGLLSLGLLITALLALALLAAVAVMILR
jgi:hypothetical protein